MRIALLHLFSLPFKAIKIVTNAWPLIALIWLFTGDTSPHFRESSVRNTIGATTYHNGCVYRGIYGTAPYTRPKNCPFIAMLTNPR